MHLLVFIYPQIWFIWRRNECSDSFVLMLSAMCLLGCYAELDSKVVAHNEAQGLMLQKDKKSQIKVNLLFPTAISSLFWWIDDEGSECFWLRSPLCRSKISIKLVFGIFTYSSLFLHHILVWRLSLLLVKYPKCYY